MPVEMNPSGSAVCHRCGTAYSRRKGFFTVSYATQHKGVGYMPVCKKCVDAMYNTYLSECGDEKIAIRQMCRKLDLYWSDAVYDMVLKKSGTNSLMAKYVAKLNTATYAGKSYDDTLIEEGTLWSFGKEQDAVSDGQQAQDVEEENVPEEIVQYWGSGYPASMYRELEQRRRYWMNNLPHGTNVSVGTEAIIRQICNLEILIAKDTAAGRSIEKSVNSLNNLLGSLNLKPAQLKDDGDSELEKLPLGVGIHMWENYRPLPPTPPEQKDVNRRVKDITTWFLGHTCHMLGVRNSYCRMYEDAMEKYRVEYPEYADEEDDDFLSDVFGSSGDET